MSDFRILNRTTVYRGWTSIDRLTVGMPDGTIGERHVEDHGQAVAVLPYDPARRVALLVSMPRPAVADDGGDLLEAPAGRIEPGENPEACAIREALEETGARLRRLDPIGTVRTMPSLSTETIALYLAAYDAADRIDAGGGAAGESECITVHELPLATLAAAADAGELPDAKTLLLLLALRLRRPELFERLSAIDLQ